MTGSEVLHPRRGALLAGAALIAVAALLGGIFGFAIPRKQHAEIVFLCNTQVICGVDPDGSHLRILVDGTPRGNTKTAPADAPCNLCGVGPAISRDGKHIAWIDTRRDLWVARPDGSHPQQILASLGDLAYLAWNPDNKRVAFIDGNAIDEVDSDGSDLHQLLVVRGRTYVDYADDAFGFSPDGKRLVFGMASCWAKGTDAISAYIAALGDTPVVMRPTVVFTRPLGWHLIWVSARARWLTVPGPHCDRVANVPIWSSRGVIALDLTVSTAGEDETSLVSVDPDARPLVLHVISEKFRSQSMSFSPNGKKLVFGLNLPELAIGSLSGGMHPFTIPFVAFGSNPTWGG